MNLSVAEIQARVAQMEDRRGFATDGLIEKCLVLGEEAGELFKVVREVSGMLTSSDRRPGSVEAELGDVMIVLCTIANRLNVNLGEAVIAKLVKDEGRIWAAPSALKIDSAG